MDRIRMMTPEQVGKHVIPKRSAQTVRLWCKNWKLPFKKGKNGKILISSDDLFYWAAQNGIDVKGV